MTGNNDQARLLMELLRRNRNTDYGRRYGFADIKTPGEFRAALPVTGGEDYAPMVALMMRLGERNIFTVDTIKGYMLNFGENGERRYAPYTDGYLALFGGFNCGRYLKNTLKPGPVFFIDPASQRLSRCNDGLALASGTGALLAEYAKNIFEPKCLVSSGDRRAGMLLALASEDLRLISAPYPGQIADSFRLLEESWDMMLDELDPKRAEALRHVFADGFEQPVAHRIWRNVAAVVTQAFPGGGAGGVERLRRYIGDIPVYNAPYYTPEALIGEPVAAGENEYRLAGSAGFFEFAPARNGAADYENTVLAGELAAGSEYGVAVTNCLGYYRYRLDGVIRVLRVEDGLPVFSIARSDGGMRRQSLAEKESELLASKKIPVTNARFR